MSCKACGCTVVERPMKPLDNNNPETPDELENLCKGCLQVATEAYNEMEDIPSDVRDIMLYRYSTTNTHIIDIMANLVEEGHLSQESI